ncbi:dual specificity protein kinase YAK1 homolog isoform X3 [Silene latifolia]|uniref:dual specificity protein kinase YAK1 homolog isoform X3 n=1 Tax=Silene latifolia TaxID=37657 RepID=UPI003D781989
MPPSSQSPWAPRQLVFRPYSSSSAVASKRPLQVAVRTPLVVKLTKHIVETYQVCNAEFRYSDELKCKRFLTSPTEGVLNDGHDNANSDLILFVNCVLHNPTTQQRYIVKDILGHGTFGQVAKCLIPETNDFVAIKVIKNQPAYFQQAWVEVSILTTLNKKFDPEDKHHIVRIYDYFVFQNHLCISFELLDTNLYELIKINNFRGLSLSIVQMFSKQILSGLGLMKEAGIIHCDLKPENILLDTSRKPPEIKIIDFGSACMEDRTVYSYIQSRYYRSPEVLLGYQYTTAIDMWSFGCIVAELFLGLPLFPGASEFDLLKRMIHILGGQPPDNLLKEAKNTSKFFKLAGSNDDSGVSIFQRGCYQALSEDEYETREKKKPLVGKEYFNYMDLEGIVAAYPYKKNLLEEDINREKQMRLALIDFLRGLVEFDPSKRWSPLQASKHPFVTGEPFTCPYRPPCETPRVSVTQKFKVDHHPGGGHWFAAGLSPNVPGRNIPMHVAPRMQMAAYAHGNSYGSFGSHNSYNDGSGLGGSYGSYGDNFRAVAYFSPAGPSAMNIHTQGGLTMVGTSPDIRGKVFHRPQGLGVSPSTGNFAPLPLGTSPSQFTPPNSQLYGSPGHYGSPVRGTCQGSPLGKSPAANHFNRINAWGYSGNMQSQPSPSSSQHHWQSAESAGFGPVEGHSMVSGGQQNMPFNSNSLAWKQARGNRNFGCDNSFPGVPNSFMHNSIMQSSQIKEAADEKRDSNLPDPGDWDPNYSDELLLQEESADASSLASEFSKVVHISPNMMVPQTFDGVERFSNEPTYNASLWRANGPTHGFSNTEMGSPPSAYNLPPGYGRSMPKPPLYQQHSSPTSPSRLAQPHFQPFGRSSAHHGNEGTHMKLQHNSFSFSPGSPQSPRGSSLNNSSPWGKPSYLALF